MSRQTAQAVVTRETAGGARPDFFLVGAPKCGTTAMCQFLGQHPAVFMPAQKEPHYFGRDLQLHFVQTSDQYAALFDGAGDRLCGEGSTWYLYSRTAAREIHEFNPRARILIMLRDPVEAMHSLHNQLVFDGVHEDIEDFAAAIEAEADRRRGLRIAATCRRPEALQYTQVVSYADQVQRYLDQFGPGQVKVILYDDFCADVVGCVQSVLSFLELEPAFQPRVQVLNPSKTARSRALRRLLATPPPITRAVVRTLLPQPMRYRLHQRLSQWNARAQRRAPMDPALRARLRAQQAPQVRRLGDMLGRDLSRWCGG